MSFAILVIDKQIGLKFLSVTIVLKIGRTNIRNYFFITFLKYLIKN